jgi:hypothetical protein
MKRTALSLLTVAGLGLAIVACDPLEPVPGDGEWSVISAGTGHALTAVDGLPDGAVLAVGGTGPSDPPVITRVSTTGVTSVGAPSGALGVLRDVVVAPSGDALAVGDAGLVVAIEGASARRIEGLSSDFDLRGVAYGGGSHWIVGRQVIPDADPPEIPVAFTFDGTAFTRVADLPPSSGALEAVWVAGDGTVHAAGSTDDIFTRRGGVWSATPADTLQLHAVAGNGALVIAVGGRTRATVLEDDGTGFRDISPSGAPAFRDVHVDAAGVVTAVGEGGAVWERRGSTWRALLGTPDSVVDVLGVHVDSDGAIWAVGGEAATPPLRDGFVWRYRPPAAME